MNSNLSIKDEKQEHVKKGKEMHNGLRNLDTSNCKIRPEQVRTAVRMSNKFITYESSVMNLFVIQ